MTHHGWVYVCFIIPCVLCRGISQSTINRIAKGVEIHCKVLDNLHNNMSYTVEIQIRNRGTTILSNGEWEIYFTSIRMVTQETDTETKYYVKVDHMNGSLFRLKPISGFPNVFPNEIHRIVLTVKNWNVARTDFMPNWYVTADGLQPRTITNTFTLNFVADYTTPKQWKRYNHDTYDPFKPEDRYYRNDDVENGKGVVQGVIPTPKSASFNSLVRLNMTAMNWTITTNYIGSEKSYLTDKLNKSGITMVTGGVGAIRLTIDHIGLVNMSAGSYILTIDPEETSIDIAGADASGVFYGIQTLLSLLAYGPVLGTRIADTPRYEYRGMHLDVARNFQSVSDVMSLLDAMSMYKMNKLHFHLSDDEGWRLEIRGLEELTTVGSQRCHDLTNSYCLVPQLGSGPESSTSGSGHYTVGDYIDLLGYARERHIEIIPEFDMPGHTHAAIKSMEARKARFLSSNNEISANWYLLSDANDTSKYLSIQMFTDNALNPCLESTYTFIEKLVKELVKYHKDSGNVLKTFHFGGDEVAHGAWINSPACEDFLSSNPTDGTEVLRAHFASMVSNITSDYGLNLGGWEDGLMKSDGENVFDRQSLANENVYAYSWNNVWHTRKFDKSYRLANAEYKVIMSHATHLYFDHPYEPDPEDRGYYWATRYTPTRKVFGFIPDDLYANIDNDLAGRKLNISDVCSTNPHPCTQLHKPENIIGIQGQLWSETVRDSNHLDYHIYPRLIALAERAWHKADWEVSSEERLLERKRDWERFINIVGYKELSRLEDIGVNYMVPPPGAKYVNGTLYVNTEIPGLNVEFLQEGRSEWEIIEGDRKKFCAGVVLRLRTRSVNGKRTSRSIKFICGPKDRPNTAFTSKSENALVLIIAYIMLSIVL